jgi:hypothetical protein
MIDPPSKTQKWRSLLTTHLYFFKRGRRYQMEHLKAVGRAREHGSRTRVSDLWFGSSTLHDVFYYDKQRVPIASCVGACVRPPTKNPGSIVSWMDVTAAMLLGVVVEREREKVSTSGGGGCQPKLTQQHVKEVLLGE